MPTRMKVCCSDHACGWSGTRAPADPTADRCPWCRLYSVEVVPRTPDPTAELFALARARAARRLHT